MEKIVEDLTKLAKENAELKATINDIFDFIEALLPHYIRSEDYFKPKFDKIKHKLPLQMLCSMYESGHDVLVRLIIKYAEERRDLKIKLLRYRSYFRNNFANLNISNKEKIDLMAEVENLSSEELQRTLINPTKEELKMILQKFKYLDKYNCRYLASQNENNSLWRPEEFIDLLCKFPAMICCLSKPLTIQDIDKMTESKFLPSESIDNFNLTKLFADAKTMAYFCYHYPSYCMHICNNDPQNKTAAYVVLFRMSVLGPKSNFSVGVYEQILAKFTAYAISGKFPHSTAPFEELLKCCEALE